MTLNDDSNTKMTIQKSFEFELLCQIEKTAGNRKVMCRNLKRSNSSLQYHLNRLRMAGLIEQSRFGKFQILRLSDLGKTIKENLGRSQGTRIWRTHALILGFELDDMGSFRFNQMRVRQMNNWHYQEEVIKDSYGEWKVHVQSTGLLKIYCPPVYTENPSETFEALRNISKRIAEIFRESYGMKIGMLREIREGEKELVGSEALGKLFKGRKFNGVFANASTGSMRLEEKERDSGIEDLMKVPELMEFIIKQQADFAKNLELHLQVLKELRDAVRELKK